MYEARISLTKTKRRKNKSDNFLSQLLLSNTVVQLMYRNKYLL
jgi:hypothetical protein